MHFTNTGNLNNLVLISLWEALFGTAFDIKAENSERCDLVVLVLEG